VAITVCCYETAQSLTYLLHYWGRNVHLQALKSKGARCCTLWGITSLERHQKILKIVSKCTSRCILHGLKFVLPAREAPLRYFCEPPANLSLLLTALAGKVKQLVASVRLSVRPSDCLHCIFWNDWPLHLSFCMCMDYDHSSPGIESQGHISRTTVNLQRVWVW